MLKMLKMQVYVDVDVGANAFLDVLNMSLITISLLSFSDSFILSSRLCAL
jgi:hypothetical protein